jgi:uncharacterized membrane protein YgdD (TMEM256/DUF423 family)
VGLSRFAARCVATGAGLMLLAVVLGAFGAHALAARLPARDLEVFDTAVSYQQIHALGLIIVGALAREAVPTLLQWSSRLMLAGIVLFSGSLYLIVAGAPRMLGAVTPFGGLAFIAAWALLAIHAVRDRSRAAPRGRERS